MKYVCDVCGWVYDESEGYLEGGILPGTKISNVLCVQSVRICSAQRNKVKRCSENCTAFLCDDITEVHVHFGYTKAINKEKERAHYGSYEY